MVITNGNGMGIIVINNGEYHKYMMGISISYMEYGDISDMVIYPLVNCPITNWKDPPFCSWENLHHFD